MCFCIQCQSTLTGAIRLARLLDVCRIDTRSALCVHDSFKRLWLTVPSHNTLCALKNNTWCSMLSFVFFFNQVGKTSPHINIISFNGIFSLASDDNLFLSSTQICLWMHDSSNCKKGTRVCHRCTDGIQPVLKVTAGSLNKLHEISVKLCFARLQVKVAAKCSVDN